MKVTKLGILGIILTIIICYILVFLNILVKDILLFFILPLIVSFIFDGLSFLNKKRINKEMQLVPFFLKKIPKMLFQLILIFLIMIFIASERYYKKTEVIQDLDNLVEHLENIHPDLYANIPKDSFNYILNDYKKNLPNKVTEFQLFKICSKLTSLFKDGHTKATIQYYFRRLQIIFINIFPYKISIIDDKIYVVENYVLCGKIPIGSEIIEINGKTAKTFIKEASEFISYENVQYRNFLLTNPYNIALWNNFQNTFHIKYVKPDAKKICQTKSSGGMIAKILSLHKQKEFQFTVLPERIGYIKISTFNTLKSYNSFFYSTFKDIQDKNIRDLIIDIRNNEGGYSIVGSELMQYILNRPYRELDTTIFKISDEIKQTGKINCILPHDSQIIGAVHKIIIQNNGLRDNKLRFKGRCFLLINKGTFSAASLFASVFKCFSNGKIIGEESGGITVCFGDAHVFNLPNSNIEIMVPWKKAYNVCSKDDRRGIIPDYIVKNKINDEIKKRDKVLEFTLDLIKNK